MKEHPHLFQTPQRDLQIANRRTKPTPSDQSRKPKKAAAVRNLDSTYSEDVLKDLSSIFEVTGDCQLFESMENFVNPSSSAAASPSVASEVSDLSMPSPAIACDLSPSSSISNSAPSLLSSTITSDKEQAGDVSVNSKTAGWETSLDAEFVAKKFKEAVIQESNSNDMVLLSKNILDALLKIVVEEFYDLPEGPSCLTEIVENKVSVILRKIVCITLTFMLLILVFGGIFFSSGGNFSFGEPLPT